MKKLVCPDCHTLMFVGHNGLGYCENCNLVLKPKKTTDRKPLHPLLTAMLLIVLFLFGLLLWSL